MDLSEKMAIACFVFLSVPLAFLAAAVVYRALMGY